MRFGERQDNHLSMKFKQLNPFEMKSELTKLLSGINSVADIKNSIPTIEMLDAQEDKTVLSKLLYKELMNSSNDKIPVVCFLMEHFIEKSELVQGLWELLKGKSLKTEVKITILNLLREMDSDWSYEDCHEYLEDADEILDANTKQLLNTAIINPEVQIDFMDFMSSIKIDDQITLINSFARDFSQDALANILIPVFESKPNSAVGREALKLLGETKSQLALSMLERLQKITTGELNQEIRRNLAVLKMGGIREDNTKEFYAKILENTKPEKFYVTYPDGHGDMAMICTRKTNENRIRFVSIVINIDTGIKDCFGFYDISQFECDKILERFLKNEKVVSVAPEVFKTILYNSEVTTSKKSGNDWELPYEYVCWKNLLLDIDFEARLFEEIIKEQILPVNVDETVFNELEEMKVSTHWFLDEHYSDEYEDLLSSIRNGENIEELVSTYREKVFYPQEKESWKNKLYVCAYIKYSLGKDDEAQKIYGLLKNDALMEIFYENILKRSIYEYFMTIKYNKDLNELKFSDEEILKNINCIEKLWVQNV